MSALVSAPDTTVVAEDADTVERDAWNEYLAHTRPLDGARYVEVESWAWLHLNAKLLRVRRIRRYDRASASETTPTRRSAR